MRALVLSPTYDERPNVALLAEGVRRALPEADLLFIDDASPDGTGEEIDRLAGGDPRIHGLHRPAKQGLGRAYLAGFAWSLARDYEATLCLDADLSHNPEDLPRLLEALREADLACGARYMPGGGVLHWPRRRLLLSRGAALYTRLLSGMPFHDPTGGLNAYRNSLLAALPLHDIHSNGYSFQIEMKHRAWRDGFRCREIPITFTERRQGRSKMSPGIVREALWVVGCLALSRLRSARK